MTQTLTAFFDSRPEAEATVAKLVDAGIPRTSIGLMPGADAPAYTPTGAGSYDYRKDEGGFWSGLKDLFLPEDDRVAYAEGMSRGGLTLSVTVDDAHIERAGDILERDAVDFDAREASWRQEGWKGYEAPASGAATAYDTAAVGTTSTSQSGTLRTSGNSAAYAAAGGVNLDQGRTGAAGVTGEEVIPLAEETLRVGKRQVSHGRVRVRSYVVETPVEEQVRLREERVNLERRAVDRPATEADQLFRERSIELEERAEEALVAKDVRVREEVRLGKEANERVETVSDTVRRTELDVQDERGQTVGGTAYGTERTAGFGGFASEIREHMDVIASDGQLIGKVDKLEGDRIKLTKNDSPDGQHHYLPVSAIDHVDTHVHLTMSASQAKAAW